MHTKLDLAIELLLLLASWSSRAVFLSRVSEQTKRGKRIEFFTSLLFDLQLYYFYVLLQIDENIYSKRRKRKRE